MIFRWRCTSWKSAKRNQDLIWLYWRDREKIEEGREEGREEAIKQLILKQYSKGLSVEYIADINEIDIEYVRDIVKNNTSKVNN